MLFRAMSDAQRSRVVAINDLADSRTVAHLFRWDSTAGPFDGTAEFDDESITVNGHRIEALSERDPERLPWGDLGVDIVLESTAYHTPREQAQKHMNAGAKKVIISSRSRNPDITINMGINSDHYDPDQHHLVATGTGFTTCLAPMAKVLNDSFGICRGMTTAIGSYLSDQVLLDQPLSDYRRGRSAPQNVIPSDGYYVGASIGQLIPELNGKLSGSVYRVPVPVGGLVELVAELDMEASGEVINSAIKAAAAGPLKRILEYTEDPIVLKDIVGNPHSCVFDSLCTQTNGNLIKVVGWMDNEWAYAHRLIELMELIGERL